MSYRPIRQLVALTRLMDLIWFKRPQRQAEDHHNFSLKVLASLCSRIGLRRESEESWQKKKQDPF